MKYLRTLSLGLVIFTQSLFAQASDNTISSTEKLELGNYLQESEYSRLAEKLKRSNTDSIHSLQILVSNFGGDVSGSKEKLKKITDDNLKASQYYYKRFNYLSGIKMLENDNSITDLYNDFSNFFEEKTDNLLLECASEIATLEQNKNLTSIPDADTTTDRIIFRNQLRLNLAYFQMSMAAKMKREARYKDSITHYRLAKMYGIVILKDLKLGDEKKAVDEKYKVDLADNNNLVFGKSKSSDANNMSKAVDDTNNNQTATK